jgi:hypothetical protein
MSSRFAVKYFNTKLELQDLQQAFDTSDKYYSYVKKVLKLYQIGGLAAIEAFEIDENSRKVTALLKQFKENKRRTRTRIDEAGSHIRLLKD